MDGYLDKEDTKALKGVAIIMMLALHLWRFPERLPGMGGGVELKHFFELFNQSSIFLLGGFGNICVDLFFFLSGYGISKSCPQGMEYYFRRIKSIYIEYWKVFFVFVPVAFLLFNNQKVSFADLELSWITSGANRYDHFNTVEFIDNLLGFNVSYNSEWWFVRSYVIAILTFPIFDRIFKFDIKKNIVIILMLSILNNTILPNIGNSDILGYLNNDWLYVNVVRQVSPFISSFWMGIICAKGAILEKLSTCIKNNVHSVIIIDIFLGLIILFFRQISIGQNIGFLAVPFLVFIHKDIYNRIPLLRRILIVLGKQSTGMWLIHSFYCYYFFNISKIITYTKWAVPSLITLILFSLVSSIVLDLFWRFISRGYNKIVNGFRKQ